MTPLPHLEQGRSAPDKGQPDGAGWERAVTSGFDPWSHWYRRALPIYWVFLACVTHFPKLSIPGKIPHSDTLTHLGAFALLAFLFWRFVEHFPSRRGVNATRVISGGFAWLALGIIAVYAAVDEYTQPLFGRDAELGDWAADVTGAGIVLATLEWLRRKRNQRDAERA